MNLSCANCEETLGSYLSDLPLAWKNQIVTAICEAREAECGDCCDGVTDCETLTSLSAFKRSGTKISITYKDEKGIEYIRNFDFTDVLNATLSEVDPKCIVPKPLWDNMNMAQKMQAILDYDCACCLPVPTTITPTTKNLCEKRFSIHNHSNSPVPFTILFKDGSGYAYVLDKTTPTGETTYYNYTSTEYTSELMIEHIPFLSVNVSIMVNGEEWNNFIQDVGIIIAIGIPSCSDVAVIITTGTVTTVASTTTQQVTTQSTTTQPIITFPTTVRPRTPITVRPGIEPQCKVVTGIAVHDIGITTTQAPTTTETTTQEPTTTMNPPILCGEQTNYKGGQSFPTEVEITLGNATGEVTLFFNSYGIPDKFIVFFEGQEVINTGYHGSTSRQADLNNELAARGLPPETVDENRTGSYTFQKTSTFPKAYLQVWAPLENTGWDAMLTCPNGEYIPETTLTPTTQPVTSTTIPTGTTTTGTPTTTTTTTFNPNTTTSTSTTANPNTTSTSTTASPSTTSTTTSGLTTTSTTTQFPLVCPNITDIIWNIVNN